MPDYRIYVLLKQTHITHVEQVTCPTDHEAVARGIDLIDDRHSVEIWQSIRLVAKLAATKPETV